MGSPQPFQQTQILVVENDPLLAEGIARTLRQLGHRPTVLADGPSARDLLGRRHAFDLVLLDLALPGLGSHGLLRQVLDLDEPTPVIALTSADGADDWASELGLSADDRVAKPVVLSMLAARIQTRLRQSRLQRSTELGHGPLLLQTQARRAWLAGEALELSLLEWPVLEYLARRPDRLVPSKELQGLVANQEASGTVEACIASLRTKLEPAGLHIRTVRGFGYMLDEFRGA